MPTGAAWRFHRPLVWVALLAPLGLGVAALSFRIQRMSLGAAQGTFWVYAALMGVTLWRRVLLLYTGAERRAGVFHHCRRPSAR